MEVFNRLRDLEVFVGEQNRKGVPMAQLYERAQYTTNVLSRLYLLICVGSVYIQSGEAPVKGVLSVICVSSTTSNQRPSGPHNPCSCHTA